MRFLLVGGAGAVGRDLTPALLSLGHAVRILDKDPEALDISGHENLELLKGRVEDRSLAAKAVQDTEVVVHHH